MLIRFGHIFKGNCAHAQPLQPTQSGIRQATRHKKSQRSPSKGRSVNDLCGVRQKYILHTFYPPGIIISVNIIRKSKRDCKGSKTNPTKSANRTCQPAETFAKKVTPFTAAIRREQGQQTKERELNGKCGAKPVQLKQNAKHLRLVTTAKEKSPQRNSQNTLNAVWKTEENVLSLCVEKRGYAPCAYPLFSSLDNQRFTRRVYVHTTLPGCTSRKNSKYSSRCGAYSRPEKAPFHSIQELFRRSQAAGAS